MVMGLILMGLTCSLLAFLGLPLYRRTGSPRWLDGGMFLSGAGFILCIAGVVVSLLQIATS
jgi:hypothetical protein